MNRRSISRRTVAPVLRLGPPEYHSGRPDFHLADRPHNRAWTQAAAIPQGPSRRAPRATQTTRRKA